MAVASNATTAKPASLTSMPANVTLQTILQSSSIAAVVNASVAAPTVSGSTMASIAGTAVPSTPLPSGSTTTPASASSVVLKDLFVESQQMFACQNKSPLWGVPSADTHSSFAGEFYQRKQRVIHLFFLRQYVF
uniref:Abdominal-A n=1 Tax=Ditylenchus dipsaci TaxID=166011 RepID=A0A915CQ98_9BILA